MGKRILTLSTAAMVAAGGLLIGSMLLPVGSPAGAAPALAPMDQSPQIARSTMLEDTIELPAGVYRMTMAELTFEPGAETPVHVHPGPSVGYVEDGRISVILAGQNTTNSYSGGSAVQHPWYTPHVFRNSTDRPASMLSFEIFPVDLPASEPAPAP